MGIFRRWKAVEGEGYEGHGQLAVPEGASGEVTPEKPAQKGTEMASMIRKATRFLTAAAFAASLLSVGCAVHARVYDPYHRDYHSWAGENGYYVQWEGETHRHHEDFNHRSDADKKEYWDWRHSHDQH